MVLHLFSMSNLRRQREGAPMSIPTWAATVEAMHREGTHVMASCQVCSWSKPAIDLAGIIAVKGPDFSLFDVKGKCPRCGGGVRFLYRPPGDHGTPFRPCITR